MTLVVTEPNQISFGQEIGRKVTHMCALAIPGGYYLLQLDKAQMLTIMVPIAVAMIVIDIARLREWIFWRSVVHPVFGRMIRDHEANGDFTGATYILLSVCFTIALYDKPVAIAALTFIIVGDTLAAIIGRKFGRHRFGHKSFEGSFACLAGTVAVAVIVWLVMPSFPLTVGLAGALVATIVEAMPLGVDDNVSVPLVSGLVMSLLMRVVIYS